VRSLGARETRELLERYGLHPKTSIGQHFVTDPNTVAKIIRIADIRPETQVLEVGPGVGALSLAIIETGAHLIAIEFDRSLRPALSEVLGDSAVDVVWRDALRVDYRKLLAGRRTAMVSNLPYQIATPLIVDLLVGAPEIESFTVMIQREVGERIAAAPGDAAYGAVSAKVAYLARARIAARVSRRVFYPMPEVESVIVRIDRRDAPAVPVRRARVFAVIEAGFAQRRKTIRRALRGAGWDPGPIESALAQAEIDPRARAETLGIEAFGSLAAALPARRSR
jgi:16S rRNA (adenine1518-N6/adenine1519-N6)-dimethyltransferase